MDKYISVVLLAAALFGIMIVQLAAKPKTIKKLTRFFWGIASISGLIFYGCAYAVEESNVLIAVFKTLMDVCGMFTADMNYKTVSVVPLFATEPAKCLFFLVHLLATYVTASAAITTLGAGALRRMRLWLVRKGELHLIYGVNQDTCAFGKELVNRDECSVLYVDEKSDPSLTPIINEMGCVVRTDHAALCAEPGFLHRIGIGKNHRKITVYTLSKDPTLNLQYAKQCIASLRDCDVDPRQTRLVILGQDGESVRGLQVTTKKYGYGYVTIVQDREMTARLLIQKYPPCNTIKFYDDGRAAEDFEALVIGFGQTGQSVLRHLIMNGQFLGSTFRAAVFAPDCQNINGYFSTGLEQVSQHYAVDFHPYDARSKAVYEHIRSHRHTLKYVVVCTGDETRDHEIALELSTYFDQLGLMLPICLCSRQGVKQIGTDGAVLFHYRLYQSEILDLDMLDQMAMIINHHYHKGTKKTAVEEWMDCDYFSRMSCRASADFIAATLRAAGKTEEQVVHGDWKLSPQLLENLSQMEHLRWCAFHYCMGFSPMTDIEYEERVVIYRRQVAAEGKASMRIGKNMRQRTHACLIDWDDLDVLSAKETQITGTAVDYKAIDTENILVVPKLLQIKKTTNEARKYR